MSMHVSGWDEAQTSPSQRQFPRTKARKLVYSRDLYCCMVFLHVTGYSTVTSRKRVPHRADQLDHLLNSAYHLDFSFSMLSNDQPFRASFCKGPDTFEWPA